MKFRTNQPTDTAKLKFLSPYSGDWVHRSKWGPDYPRCFSWSGTPLLCKWLIFFWPSFLQNRNVNSHLLGVPAKSVRQGKTTKDKSGKTRLGLISNGYLEWASQVAQYQSLLANAGDMGSTLGWGRAPGGGNGNPLYYSGLGNSLVRGTWWATVHSTAKESEMT